MMKNLANALLISNPYVYAQTGGTLLVASKEDLDSGKADFPSQWYDPDTKEYSDLLTVQMFLKWLYYVEEVPREPFVVPPEFGQE